MGATTFFTVSLGRNPHQAFDRAREEALYVHGHGGYTGTIAEKDSFKFMGQVSTPHWEKVPSWFEREEFKREHPPTARLPHKPIPPKYRPRVVELLDTYLDKWGPAICYEVTGQEAKRQRAYHERSGTWDKVYVFCGWASE
ncbi:MAG: hypothetical protein R3330_09290 [Saprospiraceae bacterium]|nr:hypothetical protein [Saprospiraceae bacterium]